VIIESCCLAAGCGCGNDGQTYYDIDDMTLVVQTNAGNPVTSAKLSDIKFTINFKVTYAGAEALVGSALYACSPAPTISKQQIAAVIITSDNGLVSDQGTKPAGDNLNFLFHVNGTSHYQDPVSDLINNPLLDNQIWFRSEKPLSTNQTHKFTFKITMDDGRAFTLLSGKLELLKG
jgi:hypothetical protein